MKHFILFFFATTLLCQGQIIDFPDINFKNALLGYHYPRIDINGDGEIQVSEAESFSGIIHVAQNNISDLTGIEYFINAIGIDCFQNNLTQVDLSNNVNLTNIYIYSNNLTELDLSSNDHIMRLNARDNQLLNIQLPDSNSSFKEIFLDNNNLTTIDLSYSPNLEIFSISNNQLNNLDLDLDANPELTILNCDNNQLTQLNLVNGIRGDFRINCSNNQLTQLYIESNYKLELDCSNNQLTALTIISNSTTKFQQLKCSGNLFTDLNISESSVIYLDCGDNPFLETINWRNGLTWRFRPDIFYNSFQNLPNLNTVCYGPSYNQQFMDFILAEVGHSVDFYNNETCDALSVNENNLNVFSITPNPAENSIKIEASTPINQIDIYNELGQLVLSKTLNTAIAKTTLDISALGQGLYFVKIADENGNSTVNKMIKK